MDDLPTEADEELYQKTCTVLPEPASTASRQQTWGCLILTMFLFALSFYGSFDLRGLLLLVGIVLFHETGHFVGMRLFRYRNVRMFFIPFFGAAVTGSHRAVPGWQQAALVLVAVNGVNLLPLVPLDGGRLLDLLLFARQPWLAVGFRLFAVAGLAVLTLALEAYCLGFLALLMLLSVPLCYRKAKRERAFRDNPLALPEHLEELDDSQRRVLFDQARQLNPLARKPEQIAAEMRNLHECMVARYPGVWGNVALLTVYGAGIAASVAVIVLLIAADRARDQRTAEQLVSDFEHVVDDLQESRRQAEQLREAADREPDHAASLMADAERLETQAEQKWSELVALWKASSVRVQQKALAQLFEHEVLSDKPETERKKDRFIEVLRLWSELGFAPK
jgi:hypothetical protein